MIGLSLAVLLLPEALSHTQTEILSETTLGQKCVVQIHDASGPLYVIINWAPCAEVRLKVMTVSELRNLGQLEGIGKYYAQDASLLNNGEVLTAWGNFAASFYVREPGEVAREIMISD